MYIYTCFFLAHSYCSVMLDVLFEVGQEEAGSKITAEGWSKPCK